MAKKTEQTHKRNGNLFDIWSIIHLTNGIMLGWLMAPFVAIVIMILYEPLEIFIISPILARYGIAFGYESIRNSLSDIVFDATGVAIGAYILGAWLEPPFHLFG